ncbi:MAG: hypothetical protein JW821_16320 [Deltaproteobacteria bacterium]|nr:hypothetical protein [Deltaproteobacteria bacterium]
MMKANLLILAMHLGMLVIILGGVLFLFTADTHQRLTGSMVAWACASATAIFLSANAVLKAQRRRIRELEREIDGLYSHTDLQDLEEER